MNNNKTWFFVIFNEIVYIFLNFKLKITRYNINEYDIIMATFWDNLSQISQATRHPLKTIPLNWQLSFK